MPLENMTPEQVDAIGRMNKQIYDEFRNLGYAGFTLDPVRYLEFRTRTNNYCFSHLVVSDAGVFFFDPARKIKYKFLSEYFLVYHDGLHAVDEEKIKAMEEPVIVLENLLEFWRKPGVGLCLVADHLNQCSYLSESQKAEMEWSQKLHQKGSLVIRPMLQRKIKEPDPLRPSARTISLED